MNEWIVCITVFGRNDDVKYSHVDYGYVSHYEFMEGYTGPTEDFPSASTRIWYFEPEE